MAAKTLSERQAALRDRREREGLVRVEVWIPAALVPKLRAYVKRLTDSAGAKRK